MESDLSDYLSDFLLLLLLLYLSLVVTNSIFILLTGMREESFNVSGKNLMMVDCLVAAFT